MLRNTQFIPRIRSVRCGIAPKLHRHSSTASFISSLLSRFNPFLTSNQNATKSTELKQEKSKKYQQRRHRRTNKPHDPISNEGILQYELRALARQLQIKPQVINQDLIKHYRKRGNFRIIQGAKVAKLSSTGKGIVIVESEENPEESLFVLVPFTLPEDVIDVKMGIHQEQYAEGHLLEIIKPSPLRNDKGIKCKHFNSCSGCQLQMLPYDDQIRYKSDVVGAAFEQFGFNTDELPVKDTVASPLQFSYRTKLTPHFNSNRKDIKIGFEGDFDGRKKIFDLDSCTIATPILNKALAEDRESLVEIVRSYKKSGTILLRDTTLPNDPEPSYTTNHKQIIKQQISNYKFQFPAGEFFQNNPSILPKLISKMSEYIEPSKHKLIIDTYCGSGFLGISLSDKIERLIGIEISSGNLQFASYNAKLNNVHNATFQLGTAEEIFSSLPSDINPRESIVILDPSRKGSNESYLDQLSTFQPDVIIYLSCNVFSQARDLEYFLKKTGNGDNYKVEVVQGWDFFPQTKHVESLVVLKHK